ncbi:hypothetical protein [Parapedobacter luteus]|uniref:hypothetical protein n=1 Tax=Parapedobacter luteus TaxID=623280 RepID=UPI0011160DA3|nr:hypothetical protein [Parapedobacter luteus]
MVIGSILFASAFLAANCFAQGDVQQAKTAALEKLSGYYQFPNNVAFVQFKLKDNTLFAKQLWDNKAYQLTQIEETTFESKEEGYKIEFLIDSSGRFTHAKIMGRIMTTKVGFDPKVIKQLSVAQLKRLEGTYSLTDDNSLKIDIRPSANGLTIKQLWDNKEIAFTPRSETFFLNEDGTFPLTFLLNGKEATQVTCFENDVWLKAK